MVFPDSDHDSSLVAFSVIGSTYTFMHQAYGADKFCYWANFNGKDCTDWQSYETASTLKASLFDDGDNFRDDHHVVMQCT